MDAAGKWPGEGRGCPDKKKEEAREFIARSVAAGEGALSDRDSKEVLREGGGFARLRGYHAQD